MKKVVSIVLLISFIASISINNTCLVLAKDIYSYNGHTYKFFDTSMTWNEARQACEKAGGHLATFTTQGEWQYIYRYICDSGEQYWLGGNDADNEGNWVWITGESWSYTDWCDNEPNNDYDGTEDYLGTYTSTHQWNDYREDEKLGYICEWDSVSENNSRETEISVILDGNTLSFEQQPTIIKGISGGRVMVPLRDIFEAMGANVKWNSENKTITAVKGEITVQMTIDSNVMTKNGVKITLDVPAQLVSGYTMIPVRAIAEAFGSNVDWNSTSKIVNIDTSSKINALIVTADNDLTGYDAGTFNEIMLNNKIAKVDESNIHTVTEPTKETFATFVNQLIVQAGENDITYFLYSGHGGISGMNKDLHPGEDAFISPYYSHTSGHDDISDENHYTITMKELIDDYLDNIPGTVVIILHSCYSGEMNQRDFGLNKDKFKIITSCSEDQTSEMEKVGLLTKGRFTDGRFMNALIKGLGVYESDNLIEKYYYKYDGEVKADYNNDRNVTLSELYKYIYENMNKEFKGDDGMKYYQTPTVSDENDETVIYSY
jgi:hypothetical protein